MRTRYKSDALTIVVPFLAFLSLHSTFAQDLRIYHQKDANQIYVGDAQVELISAGGVRVFIDVAIPRALTRPPSAGDILLITHQHYDHCDFEFMKKFPGRKLYMDAGELRAPGIHIKGIAASHSVALPAKGMAPTNYIYVVDIDHIRVVHFGDLEQKALSSAQRRKLRNIDVAFFGFLEGTKDSYYDIVEELKPRLIIPTHIASIEALKRSVAKWPSYKRLKNHIALNRKKLPLKTTFLLMGDWVKVYGDSIDVCRASDNFAGK